MGRMRGAHLLDTAVVTPLLLVVAIVPVLLLLLLGLALLQWVGLLHVF